MANPFTTRATELVKSNEAFLNLIAPDPLPAFLQPHASDDGLFRRLLSIQGQPGSGKTTIARLFEFSTLATLMRGSKNDTYSELISPLQKCGAIKDGCIHIAACRLPLESDYRELWQLPYSERVRAELLQRLIQARAILAWFSQLRKAEIEPESIRFTLRDEIHAPATFIGGCEGPGVYNRAQEVEKAVYRIVGALLPPLEKEIESQIVEPYRPFEVMQFLELTAEDAARVSAAARLCPLVILDDAHFLHAQQFEMLKTWLIRRELAIGRWILSRLDVLQPTELFDAIAKEEPQVTVPGVTAGRDIVRINLQNMNRAESRRGFRAMAKEMSRKYLGQMPIFKDNSLDSLESVLPERIDPLAPSDREKLAVAVKAAARRLKIAPARMQEFDRMAREFLIEKGEDFEDLRQAMVRILAHRYSKRTPQASLFPDDMSIDIEPTKPLKADLGVYDGACIHLLHEYGRPYFVGFDAVADTASENAEAFLHVAWHVVNAVENLLIKQKPGVIPAREQHKLLVERATMIIDAWKFPEHRRVKAVAKWIASRCVQRTRELNAPLGAGANAYGVPQAEFTRIGVDQPLLAEVLKYAVAYNAIKLVPHHGTKGRLWCLLELGGVLLVREGLTFKRGGFVEGSLEELAREVKSDMSAYA